MRFFVLLVSLLSVIFFGQAEAKELQSRVNVPLTGKILHFSDAPGPHTYRSEILHYQSKDGASIEATLLTPDIDTPKPGIVFSHMWARDRNTFWGLPEFLATYGYPSIYMDLRGHGKSKFPEPHSDVHITIENKQKSYADLYLDILPGIDILNAQPKVRKNNLILIAASLGCPLGVKAVHSQQDKFIGMIHMAPAITYFDVNCRAEFKALKPMPLYVIAEQTDKSARFAKEFFALPEGYKTIFNINRIGHGTDVLFHDLGFPTILKSWVQQIEELAPLVSKIEKAEIMV